MQKTSQQIFNDKSLVNIEKNVASVNEIFRLQNEKELSNAEKKYLPQV
jgi:phosphoenolpyruvate phosphomutase